MIKMFLYIIAFLTIAYGQSAIAHGDGHHGPVSEKQASIIAWKTAHQFVDIDAGLGFGKLKSSWKQVPPEEVRTHTKGDGYYIISLENKTEAKTLYVLMSISGDIYDANFTGDFPKLKKTSK
jgi:hypothetical protein